MKLVVATIPEDAAGLPAWLDRQLVGLDLARLVAELNAVHRQPPDRLSVETVLAGHLEQVYESGLASLPRDLLRHLLTHPALLLSLQEQVLTHGGPYWDSLARADPGVLAVVGRHQDRLPWNTTGTTLAGRTVSTQRRWSGSARTWAACMATAAAVLLLVGAWEAVRPPTTATAGWGWDRPGALPQTGTARAYLDTLADEASEWFKKKPETPEALARRINQFRQGCSTLILARHEPLEEADRKWLVERCRRWAAKLDQHLADLEAGQPVAAVRRETDATIEQLIAALRKRADASA